jgi:type II secretory pathway pseudopilin PulG
MSSLGIIAAGVAWRLFGSRKSAETLLAAMDAGDEQTRMLAGMSLVRAGARSFDLIEQRIEAGVATPSAVRLLPDLDGPGARELMQRILAHGPDDLRETAAQCISLLDRMEQK